MKSLIYGLIVLGLFIGLFIPFNHPHLYANFTDSLDLYFRSFEFNGSLYYLERSIGTALVGYNPIHWIGPINSVLVLLGILFLAFRERDANLNSLFIQMVLAHSIYLFFATTVHPWYLSLTAVLAIFTNTRYVFLWSATILLSYGAYKIEGVRESTVLLLLEYVPVFILLILDKMEGRFKSISTGYI